MAGFSQAEAEAFFSKVVDSVLRNERVLLAAFAGNEIVGTVQLVTRNAAKSTAPGRDCQTAGQAIRARHRYWRHAHAAG